jgi:hypothetical protein
MIKLMGDCHNKFKAAMQPTPKEQRNQRNLKKA